MEQVVVPQFIEAEDRILGPITVRQFAIMFVGGALVFLEYKMSDLALFILLALLTIGTTVTVAFVKINGQPFHFFLIHIIQTIKRPSIRVWRKVAYPVSAVSAIGVNGTEKGGPKPPEHQRASGQRLSELSLLVDTGGGYATKEEDGTELF